MKATLKAFTALTVVLALSGEAGAQSNFSPMMKPNLTNLVKPNLVKPNLVKPPMIISNGVKPINPNAVKPIVRPQVVRPAIAPRIDTDRLAKAVPELRPLPDKPGKQRAPGSDPAPESNGPKQAGTPIASLREHPPLPRSKPDRQVIAELPPLPRPKPNYDAGPQPEPPTLETNAGASGLPGSDNGALGQVGNVAGLEAMRDIVGDLALMQELARLGDLKELLGGNDAIDNGALGGGSSGQHSSSGWLDLVPESNTGDAGPQNDQIWKPGLPGASAYNRDPSGDQGGAFTPPARGKRDGSNIRGFGQTSGSAGPGLPGQGGETSQDGRPSGTFEAAQRARQCESDCDVFNEDGSGARYTPHEDGTYTITEYDKDGNVRVETSYDDRNRRTESTIYDTNGDVVEDRMYSGDYGEGRLTLINYRDGRSVLLRDGRLVPDSQPNPEEAGSGQSMPCPHTSSGCGPSDGPMSYQPSKWDKVSQPGAEEPSEGGFTASVTDRKNVVTNPVDPDNHLRTGGGRGPRPIEHVTEPGGGNPDTPPGS